MNSDKVLRATAIVLGLLLVLYLVRFSVGNFANVKFLGSFLFLEILIACIWRYEERFFLLLIIAFVWAGSRVPMQGTWTAARWVVLAIGAVVGFVVWMKKPHPQFSAFHLISLFCVCSALVSTTVSTIPQAAALKALSLFLLFLYGSGGARAASVGREERFFKGLLWGCEVATYVTAIAYFGLGIRFWGNPNSLGAVMSVGVFPILLWGWFTSEVGLARWRRLAALLLCTFLSYFSLARAGMVSTALVTLAFCFALRQYKLLMKVTGWSFFLFGLLGMVNPAALSELTVSAQDAVLYKGHKDEGVLGSRRAPWEKTVTNIKQHPWLGTGYGTGPTGEDVGLGLSNYSSTLATSHEHGSSYITILEGVGLLGGLPFVALMALNAFHVLKVGLWMHRTRLASHYSVPLAMVLFAGFIHASFEDWMFAVGYYLCVYFWALGFVLSDLLPATGEVRLSRLIPGTSRPAAIRVGAIAPGR